MHIAEIVVITVLPVKRQVARREAVHRLPLRRCHRDRRGVSSAVIRMVSDILAELQDVNHGTAADGSTG